MALAAGMNGGAVAMHYQHKVSKIKKARKQGFRARMRTSKGRDIINRQRRQRKMGRSVTCR